MSDDESLAREAREAHDLDKATFEAVRADGTLDRLRRRLVDDAYAQADLRQFVADALRTSATLNAPGARRENEKALLDALRAELEERVVAAFSQRAWATMLDESQGLGREIYEAVYVAREGAEAATKTEG